MRWFDEEENQHFEEDGFKRLIVNKMRKSFPFVRNAVINKEIAPRFSAENFVEMTVSLGFRGLIIEAQSTAILNPKFYSQHVMSNDQREWDISRNSHKNHCKHS